MTPMMNGMPDLAKLGQANVETSMRLFGEFNKNWQHIAAEMTDYTKRSFEDGTATFEKLISAKSIEQAFDIQTTYAKRAYDEYVAQLSKIGSMYAELAKEAVKPVERAMQGASVMKR